MDISLNMIDLEYLTNPIYIRKKTQVQKKSNKNEIGFYRKRIFKLTKELLCNQSINASMNNAFENYAEACIKHLKFKDQSEVIQGDYQHIKKKDEEEGIVKKGGCHDHLMMRKITPMSNKITDYIPIKIHKPQSAPPFFPVSRNIDFTDPNYRTKGILKKNVSNTYGKKDEKKNKEETSKKKTQKKNDKESI